MAVRSNPDPYTDGESGVLRNNLGITDGAELYEAEATFYLARTAALAKRLLPGKYDLAHLKAFHRHLFGDVYPWAGELRTIDISKGDSYFAHFPRIESAGNKLFDQLAREKHLAGLGPREFSERAGYYLGEMNALHPFREGNGRTQRAFISQLAEENGYFIHWRKVTREQMADASIRSFKGDSSALSGLILSSLERNESGPAQEDMPRRRFNEVPKVVLPSASAGTKASSAPGRKRGPDLSSTNQSRKDGRDR